MIVLVSSCIMGCNCKYNGGNNFNKHVMQFLKGKKVIEICPEILAGMSIPRPCAEIVNGFVTEDNGKIVHDQYKRGVKLALKKIKNQNIELVILQSRSPTCGVNEIYDGTFTGKLIHGQGIFAKALIDAGYKVVDAEDFK